MRVGVIGLGFVGGAMLKSFEIRNGEAGRPHDFVGYDKYKNGGIGSFESCLETEVLFLALPTPYDRSKREYCIEPLLNTVSKLRETGYRGAVVIKSTINPGTTERLAGEYGLNFIHNPEFLTARTAFRDFHQQTHIVLGRSSCCSNSAYSAAKQLYTELYPAADLSETSAGCSELMKNYLNCFYAAKVQIFTEFQQLCERLKLDFEKVRELMLKNNWINPMHTKIPGPDGQISYGGLCFPKDTNALFRFMETLDSPRRVLGAVIEERNEMRDDHDNIK